VFFPYGTSSSSPASPPAQSVSQSDPLSHRGSRVKPGGETPLGRSSGFSDDDAVNFNSPRRDERRRRRRRIAKRKRELQRQRTRTNAVRPHHPTQLLPRLLRHSERKLSALNSRPPVVSSSSGGIVGGQNPPSTLPLAGYASAAAAVAVAVAVDVDVSSFAPFPNITNFGERFFRAFLQEPCEDTLPLHPREKKAAGKRGRRGGGSGGGKAASSA